MKYLFVTILFLISCIVNAQDSNDVHVETPKIVTKLILGAELKVEEATIRFVDVESDSRCPKNVNCVRAGEAKVAYEVYEKETLVKRDLIEITPTTYLGKTLPLLYSTNNSKIEVYNLMPYPESGIKIKKEDYYLQIEIEN